MSSNRRRSSPAIEIVGADANNLKQVDVEFPLGRLSVVTGVSGSGKSSLLADTLAAEGSRRMRLFLGTSQEELERDDVTAYLGRLPPTVLVGQRGFRPSVRTTVGTATGFLLVLRKLYLFASAPFSESANDEVPPPSPESYAGWLARHYHGTAEVWAAPVRNQSTDGAAAVSRLAERGVEEITVYSDTDPPRLREKGRQMPPSEFKPLNPAVSHTIEARVGTVEISGASREKPVLELLQDAFEAGSGSVVVMLPGASEPELASEFGPRLDSLRHWVHPGAAEIFFPPTAHLLSFNAPGHEESGACPACKGTGIGQRLVLDALIPHPERSMRQGAFALWTEKNYKYVHVQHERIEGLAGLHGFAPDVPWSKLPERARRLVLDGTGDEGIFDRDRSGRKIGAARPFPGFRNIILDKAAARTKTAERLSDYVETGLCDACGGSRWSFQARALRVGGYGIAEILAMSFTEVEALTAKGGAFAQAAPAEARSLVESLRRHAHSLGSVGLGYLAGDRGMLDVSEGESRRVRLARVLDAGERGLCLLLDEPARGLHEADLVQMTAALKRLKGGHTVILNEHRERLWDAADWFIEMGPGAGAWGGEVSYAGPRAGYEPELEDEPLRKPQAVTADQPWITIRGASIHNVEGVDCEIPLGRLTCLCGVSGSGKSNLLRGVIAPALLQEVGAEATDFVFRDGRWRSVSGTGALEDVVALDQAMPPPNRRSLVATFTGVFDGIRKVFGSSPAAVRDGLSPSDFGVNAGAGRCQVCQGVGQVSDNGHASVCPACGGSRYGHEALSVRIAGINVEELLSTPVEYLGDLSEAFRLPQGLIDAMNDLGLGYVSLGRRIDTLSGGEVQRLRLALRLGGASNCSTLFLLDEPAVGLHARDVGRLAAALERVLDDGRNTLVLVEHDLRLLRSADWLVELGPGSGPEGGQVIFAGSPRELEMAETPTGLALAGRLPEPQRPLEARQVAESAELSIEERTERTQSLLRTLIHGDGTAAPRAKELGEGLAEPVVVLSEQFWEGRDEWEVAGLDCELPKLLLDIARPPSTTLSDDLLARWQEEPEAWLAIQPFLSDIEVWGKRLPESVLRKTSDHLIKEGLHLVTTKGEPPAKAFEVGSARATGSRFVPEEESSEAQRQALRDAFAVGARYVELRDRRGRLLATATDRLLDLDRGHVAPMSPLPAHFSRLDPRGRCPMCQGSRGIEKLPEDLVIGRRTATPDSESFLTPEAHAVMKGVRRNELLPFLRRLATERLWDLGTPFANLDRQDQELLLFGFWARPGAGSFLKNVSSDPGQVSSWLRWDGLYRHVLEQVDRSPDHEWARRIHEGKKTLRCVLCGGSGLQGFAELLQLGSVSFPEWALLGDPNRRLDLVRQVEARSPRQRRTLDRLVHCLTPLGDMEGSAVAIAQRSVQTFTTMAVVTSSDGVEN